MRNILWRCVLLLGMWPLFTNAAVLSLNRLFEPTRSLAQVPVDSVHYTLTGTSGDSADYIVLYQATDNTCSSPTAIAPTVITQGTALNFNTTYAISPVAIDTFLNSPNNGIYYIGIYFKSSNPSCTIPSHCMCIVVPILTLQIPPRACKPPILILLSMAA